MQWPKNNLILEILKTIGILLVSFFLYSVASNLGLNFATVNKQASPVWPATGFAIMIIYFFGPRAAVGIFAAAALSNFQVGSPLGTCLIIGAGNTLEAIFGVAFFKYLLKSKIEFGTHSLAVFAIFSLACAASISSTVGSFALFANGSLPHSEFFNIWKTWWIGDFLGGLFLAPFAYKASVFDFHPLRLTFKKYGLLLALLALTLFVNYFVFSSGVGSPYLFLVFFPILLAAFWFDVFLIYSTSLLIFGWAIVATVMGDGPFASQILNESLTHLQLFLLGLGITSLGLGGLQGPSFNHRVITALVFGWILSGLSFFSFFNSAQEVDRSHFFSKTDQAQLYVETQLSDYTNSLQSSVGFFAASERVTQEGWTIFSKKLLLNREFEKVEGVGIILPSPTQNVEDFYKHNDIRKPIANLKIHDPYTTPAGYKNENPEIHLIAIYVEPLELNKRAVGIDISMEKNRYRAALQARDTGLPSITDNIILFQNKVASSTGFILFIPLYKKNYPIETVAQRKKAFTGLVFSPVIADKFFKTISEKFNPDLTLEVYMSAELDRSNLIFSSTIPPLDPENKIIKSTQLLGKKMIFVWRKSQTFEQSSGLVFSLISFFGATVTLFLAIMLSSLQNITLKAQAIADEKTKEVVEKNIIWKNLTETSPVGIYLCDKQGRCTYVNRTLTELTGLSSEEALGDGWINAIYEDDVDLFMKNWQNMLLTGKFSCNYRFHTKKNEVVHISGRAIALKNNDGDVTGYLGITQDVSDSFKKGTALIAASRMSSLGEMASGIAHEINNPLSIILGKSFLLQTLADSENYDATKVKLFSQQIADTVHRISRIIKGLRSFARETTGEPFEKYAINDVVNETLDFCRERFNSHHIDLFTPPQIDPNLYFFGRSEQIAQVLLNLLNNAFDATINYKTKWVRIDLETTQKKIRIKISNSGELIKPADGAKIFDPFYTTKQVGKGTGLGLSISKGIIETHRGALTIDFTASHTTFVVELDLASNDQLSKAADHPPLS